MKRYVKSYDEFSSMKNCKYCVTGGPYGDYIGDYDEDLANYYGQKTPKPVHTNSEQTAIETWLKFESKFPMDADISVTNSEDAMALCQWVVDNEDKFKQMYDKSNCHYKYDYLIDGAQRYATRPQQILGIDQVFPFCRG